MSARAKHSGAVVPFFQLSGYASRATGAYNPERETATLLPVVATASLAFVATSPLAAAESRRLQSSSW